MSNAIRPDVEYQLRDAKVSFEIRVEPEIETEEKAIEAAKDYILMRTNFDAHDLWWSFEPKPHADGGYAVLAENNCLP